MKEMFRKVHDSGDYLNEGAVEWRIVRDSNMFYNLQMRLIDESGESDRRWNSVFITDSP